jgi:ADP-ribose pyrophosphatase
LYLAKNAHFVGKGESDDLEAMETLELTKSELKAALKAGQFKVISWATTVALALQHLED